MIFQDPLSSLDPRMRISEIIVELLRTHRPETGCAERAVRVSEAMPKQPVDQGLRSAWF